MSWGYYSYDIDDDDNEYCAKTDFRNDGTVHRYEGTDGDFDKGHGHRVYGSTDDFLSDADPTYDRPADAPESQGRNWDERH